MNQELADVIKRVHEAEQKIEKMDKGLADFARTVASGMLEMRLILERVCDLLPDNGLVLPPTSPFGDGSEIAHG